jgi:uncharacterized phage protein (TIGR02220 family)
MKTEEVSHYDLIINHLNSVAGTRFKPSGKTVKGWIDARLKDGFNIDDFYYVHTVKVAEWGGTEFAKYLRPQTLYRPDNFQSYLNQQITRQDKSRMINRLLSDQGISIFDIYEGNNPTQLTQLGVML